MPLIVDMNFCDRQCGTNAGCSKVVVVRTDEVNLLNDNNNTFNEITKCHFEFAQCANPYEPQTIPANIQMQ